MVRQKRNIDFGFWVNFRQEDRICRKGGVKKKLKPETGDRKGRGEQLVKDAEILDGGLWIGDSAAVAVNLISTAYRPTGFF